jgi:hypothetical protein
LELRTKPGVESMHSPGDVTDIHLTCYMHPAHPYSTCSLPIQEKTPLVVVVVNPFCKRHQIKSTTWTKSDFKDRKEDQKVSCQKLKHRVKNHCLPSFNFPWKAALVCVCESF